LVEFTELVRLRVRYPLPPPPRPSRKNTVAIVSPALGLISLPLVLFVLPAVLAIALGVRGASNARQGDPHGGPAEWGILLGILSLGILVFVLAVSE
jgi:hypothetical protein